MLIKTADINSFKHFFKDFPFPQPKSHKGQNGKVLIIGGSSLFHAASIWAAEIASHFVDMVHYSSTKENNKVFLLIKKKFRNGIVIRQKDLLDYVKEDDAILIGPGMLRGEIKSKLNSADLHFSDVLKIKDEPVYTYNLTKYLLENFPQKKFVLDAGALQILDPRWLLFLKVRSIITPHRKEFERLFRLDILRMGIKEKLKIIKEVANKWKCVILLKAVDDFISDGKQAVVVNGGNAGLTKGGSGDVLAGLVASLYAKIDAFKAAVLASIILKKTADELFLSKGYWYNISDIIEHIPNVVKKIVI